MTRAAETRRARRLERRRQLLTARMAAAQTPAERVAVMVDYLRAALVDAEGPVAEAVATRVVQFLGTQADHITGLRPGGDTP